MKRVIETTVLASLLLIGFGQSAKAQSPPAVTVADHLVISEVAYDGKKEEFGGSSEYLEIFNPTSQPIALDTVYVTDVVSEYVGITDSLYSTTANRLSLSGSVGNDFVYRFPAGAVLRPGAVAVVVQDSETFLPDLFGPGTSYNLQTTAEQLAAYEKTGGLLFETKQDGSGDGVEDMAPMHSLTTTSGSTKARLNLTNSGELVVLFHWDGTADAIVEDLDSVSWGTLTGNVVDKSNQQAPDGTSYRNDAGSGTKTLSDIPRYTGTPSDNSSSSLHPFSLQRQSAVETGETQSGGNGFTGHDESTEDWTQTFGYRDMDPGEVPLLGTAQVGVTTTLAFGTVGAGQTQTATLTVANTGAVAVPIHTLTFTSATPTEFAIAGVTLPLTKPLLIGANEQLALPVAFTPTLPSGVQQQARSATLTIGFCIVERSVAAPDENVRHDETEAVAISGTAGAPPTLAVTSGGQTAPGTLAFATTFVGQSREIELTLENQGVADLRITGFVLDPANGAYSLDSSASAIATPGQPVTRRVRFSPTATGQLDGTLTILSNDPNTPVKVFNLSGFASELARTGGRSGGGGGGCQLSDEGSPVTSLLWLGLIAALALCRPGRRES